MKRILMVLILGLIGNFSWGKPTTLKTRKQSAAIAEKFMMQKPPPLKYNEPADLIDLIPIIRDINALIPRSFSLAHHYFEVTGQRMVIQHHNLDLRTRTATKKAIIALYYTGDIGTTMGTEVEMPLFYSSILGLSSWYRYPMGNYRMTLDQTQTNRRDIFYIKAQTKF